MDEAPRSQGRRIVGLVLLGFGGVLAALVLNVALILAFGGSAWWEAAVTLALWGGLGLLLARWGRRWSGPVTTRRRSSSPRG